MKTKYTSVKNYNRLHLYNFPSAGPYPNIAGMRSKYWGRNAYILKCGVYAYKVDHETFWRA